MFYSKMNLLIFVPNMVPNCCEPSDLAVHRPSTVGGLELNHGSDITSKAMYHRIEQVGGGWCGFFWWFENLLIFLLLLCWNLLIMKLFATNSWTQKRIFQNQNIPHGRNYKEHIMRFHSTNFFVTSFILCLWGHPSQFETVGLTKMGMAIAIYPFQVVLFWATPTFNKGILMMIVILPTLPTNDWVHALVHHHGPWRDHVQHEVATN